MNKFANKYAPKKLSQYIFEDDSTRDIVKQYVSKKRDGNIILHGPFGTGKTTLARIIAADRVDRGKLILFETHKCALFRAPDVKAPNFENRVVADWNMQNASPHNAYSIVDEVDQIDRSSSNILRAIMEKHSGLGNFIMTTNYLHAVDAGIRNRCEEIEIPLITPSKWHRRSKAILRLENVRVSDQDLDTLLTTVDGTIRDLLRTLEQTVAEHSVAADASQAMPATVP